MVLNHVEVWERCLETIKDNLPNRSYKTWFEPLIPLKLESNVLTIQVPTHFFMNLLKRTISTY